MGCLLILLLMLSCRQVVRGWARRKGLTEKGLSLLGTHKSKDTDGSSGLSSLVVAELALTAKTDIRCVIFTIHVSFSSFVKSTYW